MFNEGDVAGLSLGERSGVRDGQVAVAEDFAPYPLGEMPDCDGHGGPLLPCVPLNPLPGVWRKVPNAGNRGKSNRCSDTVAAVRVISARLTGQMQREPARFGRNMEWRRWLCRGEPLNLGKLFRSYGTGWRFDCATAR